MKANQIVLGFVLVALSTFSGCLTQQVSVIVGGEYDKTKDTTSYFVLPYGSVEIPGKWDKTHSVSVSHQQFFKNKDSIELAISFGPTNQYPFNTNGSLMGYKFVKAFYEWDSKYFVDTHGLNRTILEEDSVNNFIAYRIHGTTNNVAVDTYFLVGVKSTNVSNFSISITDKWTEQKKVDFLKSLFLPKNTM